MEVECEWKQKDQRGWEEIAKDRLTHVRFLSLKYTTEASLAFTFKGIFKWLNIERKKIQYLLYKKIASLRKRCIHFQVNVSLTFALSIFKIQKKTRLNSRIILISVSVYIHFILHISFFFILELN